MSTINYSSWALIPASADPLTARPHSTNVPMMITVALDSGASLVFQLTEGIERAATIEVKATALSCEGQPDPPFAIYSGSATGNFRELSVDHWTKSVVGPDAILTAELPQCDEFVKLVSMAATTLIVNTVTFES